jgi:hypothetical protein
MTSPVLDLDTFKSITHLGIHFDVKYMNDSIYKLIDIIKHYGKYIGILYYDIGQVSQYLLKTSYLKNTMDAVFEFDSTFQFINIVYYNTDQTKTYLKLFLSINDEPTIKYIENDRSGFVPCYTNDKITLKPGEYLVHMAHCLLSYIGFNRIRLDDDSYLITKNKNGDEIRTKLWLYYLLKNGKSWYSKFGYEPGNCCILEYNLLIADVQLLKLQEISACLQQILATDNRQYLDNNLVETSEKIVSLIGKSEHTLYGYTINHCLEEFTNLTNNLMQSIYSKNVSIKTKQLGGSINNHTICESDEDSDCEHHTYTTISFPWYHKIKKLLIANITQVNNDINHHFYYL